MTKIPKLQIGFDWRAEALFAAKFISIGMIFAVGYVLFEGRV